MGYAIKLLAAQKRDDMCWMDLQKLFDHVGVKGDFEVGDADAMLKNCERYVRQVCIAGGPWLSYAELEQQNESLASAARDLAGQRLDDISKLNRANQKILVLAEQLATVTRQRDEAREGLPTQQENPSAT